MSLLTMMSKVPLLVMIFMLTFAISDMLVLIVGFAMGVAVMLIVLSIMMMLAVVISASTTKSISQRQQHCHRRYYRCTTTSIGNNSTNNAPAIAVALAPTIQHRHRK